MRLDLASVRTTAGVSEAMTQLVDAVAEGQVTPEEAATVAGVLEIRRRVLKTEELCARIEHLETEVHSR